MRMKYDMLAFMMLMLFFSCTEQKEPITAKFIVDKGIAVSGGEQHATSKVRFKFRDAYYESELKQGKKLLKRITMVKGVETTDVRLGDSFQRFVNDSVVPLTDSLANGYSNSVNSVHYFSRLPYGLNDPAVHKKLLGKEAIKDVTYFKLQVTFSKDNGGDDFDDVYVYWFDVKTFKPKYLAYTFQVNGGGIRFREAVNERYVNGIRFVDYNNYRPKSPLKDVVKVGKWFEADSLELLSKIEIENIQVIGND